MHAHRSSALMSLQGDEDPELPRHRPADGHRHRVAAGRRRRRSSRPTSRARSRTRSRRCRASSTSTPRCRTASSTIDGRVPPREADAGSGRRRARRGLARALRPAGRAARSDHHQVRPRRLADPDLHGRVEPHGRRGAVLVRRQHGDASAARGARRRRGDARRRRRRARSGSSSTRRACWRSNATAADISRQLRQMQREASGGRTDVGGAEQSVRTIATVQSAAELAAMEIALSRRPPHPARPGRARQRHRRRAALGRAARTASRWSASRSCARAAPARSRSSAGVRAALETLQEAAPRHHRSPRRSTSSIRSRRTTRARWRCCSRAPCSRCWSCSCSCATGARRWSPSTALPLSIIPAFWAMYLLGFTLNVRDAARALARGRHPGRRRDRRDREHHAPPAAWARRPTRRRWRRPTRSAWR